MCGYKALQLTFVSFLTLLPILSVPANCADPEEDIKLVYSPHGRPTEIPGTTTTASTSTVVTVDPQDGLVRVGNGVLALPEHILLPDWEGQSDAQLMKAFLNGSTGWLTSFQFTGSNISFQNLAIRIYNDGESLNRAFHQFQDWLLEKNISEYHAFQRSLPSGDLHFDLDLWKIIEGYTMSLDGTKPDWYYTLEAYVYAREVLLLFNNFPIAQVSLSDKVGRRDLQDRIDLLLNGREGIPFDVQVMNLLGYEIPAMARKYTTKLTMKKRQEVLSWCAALQGYGRQQHEAGDLDKARLLYNTAFSLMNTLLKRDNFGDLAELLNGTLDKTSQILTLRVLREMPLMATYAFEWTGEQAEENVLFALEAARRNLGALTNPFLSHKRSKLALTMSLGYLVDSTLCKELFMRCGLGNYGLTVLYDYAVFEEIESSSAPIEKSEEIDPDLIFMELRQQFFTVFSLGEEKWQQIFEEMEYLQKSGIRALIQLTYDKASLKERMKREDISPYNELDRNTRVKVLEAFTYTKKEFFSDFAKRYLQILFDMGRLEGNFEKHDEMLERLDAFLETLSEEGDINFEAKQLRLEDKEFIDGQKAKRRKKKKKAAERKVEAIKTEVAEKKEALAELEQERKRREKVKQEASDKRKKALEGWEEPDLALEHQWLDLETSSSPTRPITAEFESHEARRARKEALRAARNASRRSSMSSDSNSLSSDEGRDGTSAVYGQEGHIFTAEFIDSLSKNRKKTLRNFFADNRVPITINELESLVEGLGGEVNHSRGHGSHSLLDLRNSIHLRSERLYVEYNVTNDLVSLALEDRGSETGFRTLNRSHDNIRQLRPEQIRGIRNTLIRFGAVPPGRRDEFIAATHMGEDSE